MERAIDRLPRALLRDIENEWKCRPVCKTNPWQPTQSRHSFRVAVGSFCASNASIARCRGAYLVKATDTCGYARYARSLFYTLSGHHHLVEDDEVLEAVLRGGKARQAGAQSRYPSICSK